MKNSVYLFAAVVMIAFNFSCSSDDTNSTEPDLSGDIVGMWKRVEKIRENDGVEVPTDYCEEQDSFEFTENGEAIDISHYISSEGCTPNPEVIYSYWIEENMLHLVVSFGDNTYHYEEDIIELTATTLTIRVSTRYIPTGQFVYLVTYKRAN